MNCPQCGKEMESGWVYGKAPLIWSPKPGKKTLIQGREDVSLIKGDFPAAHICRDCRKVVLTYLDVSPYDALYQ